MPVRVTTSKDPSKEFLLKSKSLAPDKAPAFTISPSGRRTFAAAVM